ncbi:hypothetical protein [Spirilliplanes yamanashiensis]|uniref:Uncharacterized protein n=1 Tax=Spirilliplanes yamanashiensis TaxID=42233 RepID=A0A8J4DGZ8_9ACTN|nr:hypothetical protein [Spirilliplanes yamanashiensis]MDP9819997.1 hypothetical protein [Spirilliplanes yamanashiensis]GIJ01184.1 hypothetical protein Sya03_05360 [Spirilliplanes yamanashiensis]
MPETVTRVKLSAAIMTHPARLDRARALRDRHPEHRFRIVVDPHPEQGPSALRTARLAWAAADPCATHHMVVQDDAVLGDPDSIEAAVRQRPTDALSLFTEWGSATSFAVRLAALAGVPWAETVDHYTPTVAAVLPAAVARGFAEYPATVPQDDVALRTYLLREGVSGYVPVPGLADHDPGVSLTGNDVMGARRAACHLPGAAGPDGRTAFSPAVLPFFSWVEGRALCNVREDPAGAAWRRELPAWYFAHRGLDAAEVAERGKAAVRPHAGGPVAPILLYGLWVTACQFGVELARIGVTPDPAAPAAREALRTLPWGVLRRFAPDADLRAAEPAVRDLLLDGLRYGGAP